MRPLIGLTATPTTSSDGLDYARLRMTYVRAIERAGGAPVLVPPLEEATLHALLERLDGLVLPGGADIDPAEYGQPLDGSTDINHGLGQQLLNVALGGSLIQDLPRHPHSSPRTQTSHAIEVDPASRLAALVGSTRFDVNSLHHQAVKALGRRLKAVAWAEDGTIEGLESDAHPWLVAVQFHPEDLVESHAQSRQLVEAFVEAARARKGAPSPALR
jgi:putative glutamine amidotransferase